MSYCRVDAIAQTVASVRGSIDDSVCAMGCTYGILTLLGSQYLTEINLFQENTGFRQLIGVFYGRREAWVTHHVPAKVLLLNAGRIILL